MQYHLATTLQTSDVQLCVLYLYTLSNVTTCNNVVMTCEYSGSNIVITTEHSFDDVVKSSE